MTVNLQGSEDASEPFPARVLVDQVVTVNRGVRAVGPLETGWTGTLTQWRLNRWSRPRWHAAA